MSSSQHMDEIFRESFRVRWGAFTSDAYTMQREGWEFVVNRDSYRGNPFQDVVNILARHRSTGWTMWGDARLDARDRDRHHAVCGEIQMQGCRPDTQIQMMTFGSVVTRQWQRVDMEPQVTRMVTLYQSGIFPAYLEPERKEIIVAPDEVADLLARITKLQQPEMLAIRERNRQREARERLPERTHATILSIAA